MIIIDDPRPESDLTPEQREAVRLWFEATLPAASQCVHGVFRALDDLHAGQLVVLDRDVSDRHFPDIEQMLEDTAHA